MLSPRLKKKKIPVLCYHGANAMLANSRAYLGNDQTALAEDLTVLQQRGYRLINGLDVVNFILGKVSFSRKDKVICISFDDAPILDYQAYDSPKIGRVTSFRSTLLQSEIFQRSQACVLNFVIADETARNELDVACLQGNADLSNKWWEQAIDKRLYDIANHSFDHMHEALQSTAHSRGEQGNFFAVDNYTDANTQIRLAYDKIQTVVNHKATPLFGYPYGHVSDYLRDEYFPNYTQEHQQQGAFSTGGEYVTEQTNIWEIPRFVCGHHWKTPAEFDRLLRHV